MPFKRWYWWAHGLVCISICWHTYPKSLFLSVLFWLPGIYSGFRVWQVDRIEEHICQATPKYAQGVHCSIGDGQVCIRILPGFQLSFDKTFGDLYLFCAKHIDCCIIISWMLLKVGCSLRTSTNTSTLLSRRGNKKIKKVVYWFRIKLLYLKCQAFSLADLVDMQKDEFIQCLSNHSFEGTSKMKVAC